MEARSNVLAAPQHMLALERANRVRLARAGLKRRVASTEIDAADVILDCPWEAESMTVSELLMSQRRWGRTRCRRFLLPLNLNENKTLASLTDRQRLILSAALRTKAMDAAGVSQRQPAGHELVAA